MVMRFSEFQEEINRMASAATDEARFRFALDTIRLLHQSVKTAITEEMSGPEQALLEQLLNAVYERSFDGLRPKLEALLESMSADSARAQGFHPDIDEVIASIDNLLDYALLQNPQSIARIAISMVNSIDYSIGDQSVDNIMAAQEMRDEYERQKRLLCP